MLNFYLNPFIAVLALVYDKVGNLLLTFVAKPNGIHGHRLQSKILWNMDVWDRDFFQTNYTIA